MNATFSAGKGSILLAGIVVFFCNSCTKEEEGTPDYPQVTTSQVENITSSSATVNGNVTFDGGSPISSRGFQYGRDDQNIFTYTIHAGTGTGAYYAVLSNLERNTKYHVRAFATNAQNTGYGEIRTFTTEQGSSSEYPVTFNVDLSYYPYFDTSNQEIYLSGEFTNGWAMPGSDPQFRMSPSLTNDKIYTLTMVLDTGARYYKYFRIIDQVPSWDHGEWDGDPNRTITVHDTMVVQDIWNFIGDDTSLFGSWDAGDFEIVIPGYYGYFSEINSGFWLSALNNGYISYFFPYVGLIVKTGENTYNGQVIMYHTTNNEVDATFWSTTGNLTLSENKNTLTVFAEGIYNYEVFQQTVTFTRKLSCYK